MVLTHHGEGADTGLHGAFVLLLQPRTLEQPRGGLQQLHHNCLVCLQENRTGGSSATQGGGTGPGPSLPLYAFGLDRKSPVGLALNNLPWPYRAAT